MNRSALCIALAAFTVALPLAAGAADLVVNVVGVADPGGQVGCALFKGADGFPMDTARAQQQWRPADAKGVQCRFSGLADGAYAVSISHDANGNGKVDTNVFGIPSEAWGVSNNVRPTMRAPRFEEAVFRIAEGRDLTLEVRVAK